MEVEFLFLGWLREMVTFAIITFYPSPIPSPGQLSGNRRISAAIIFHGLPSSHDLQVGSREKRVSLHANSKLFRIKCRSSCPEWQPVEAPARTK